MIRSKLGRLWRILKDEVVPVFVGALFMLSFLAFSVLVAYSVCRGWLILFTGDVEFLPALPVLLSSIGGW